MMPPKLDYNQAKVQNLKGKQKMPKNKNTKLVEKAIKENKRHYKTKPRSSLIYGVVGTA